MSFLSNAHTHTHYCDGKNSPAEMLRVAQALGFVSLGFSGHGAQGFDSAYAMDDGRQEAYRLTLRALQQEHQSKRAAPRIWVGLEQDASISSALKQRNREAFDYILGSTHYLSLDFGGRPVAVDGNLELVKAYIQQTWDGDALEMARLYFKTHVDMLLSDKPDIIGHFDLARKTLEAYPGFDLQSAAYQRLALDALEKARACGGVLEMNTGGMARGYMREPYPTRELLAAWREMGGAVTLTSDCHDALFLDYGLDAALKVLKELGYRSLHRLGQGDSLWEVIQC